MLIFFEHMDKRLFFQRVLKNINFPWILNFLFLEYGQKTTFSKLSQINVIFLEMCIFSDIWTKNHRNTNDLNKGAFSLNFDIFGEMGKTRLFQSDLKILWSDPQNVGIFGHMHNNYIFSKNSKEKYNFLEFDIFGDMCKKLFFQSDP